METVSGFKHFIVCILVNQNPVDSVYLRSIFFFQFYLIIIIIKLINIIVK